MCRQPLAVALPWAYAASIPSGFPPGPIGGITGHAHAQLPREAYEIEPADYPTGWFTIRCNGIPVWHAPSQETADRYATDPEHRARLVTKKAYER